MVENNCLLIRPKDRTCLQNAAETCSEVWSIETNETTEVTFRRNDKTFNDENTAKVHYEVLNCTTARTDSKLLKMLLTCSESTIQYRQRLLTDMSHGVYTQYRRKCRQNGRESKLTFNSTTIQPNVEYLCICMHPSLRYKGRSPLSIRIQQRLLRNNSYLQSNIASDKFKHICDRCAQLVPHQR